MIVVNFSTERFYTGQERLLASLNGAKSLMIRDHIEGCPTHEQSPYEFKVHAIEKAFELDDVVLWADSSMYLVGDLSKLEKIILEDGYFMQDSGHDVGHWCNAFTRKYFNLQDWEECYRMFIAGLFGLNKKSEEAMHWFYRWKESAEHGCFKGNWSDHRHDMVCGSIIAKRKDFKYHHDHKIVSYVGPGYPEPNHKEVFHCQGI
jgi:hypothetical protein